ncbi:flavodoxin [Halobacteroides halobius DSM 5150]|uniref:Flavodoxin n=1 Tax=Halobacteroides halobius (strain ATCC 35273 / DSM 5150 / MD-1) TaxID=748449 RepID=L0K9F5_HALHC|nr:flavodoxin domain-containing protein [Halobacteroides halobius]AGB40989.1 flavodoxin [Halobacteroides halobius DSM 5150]
MKEEQKVIVVYKSKYGSTKCYAEWIAQAVKGDLFESSEVKSADLFKYDTIIFGGGLYAVGIIGVDIIKNNFEQLKDKKLIVYAVGASSGKEEDKNNVLNNNFTAKMKEKIDFFMLRGAFNRKRLNLIDRFLMWILKLKLKSKDPKELKSDEKGILDCYDTPMDWTNKEAIIPIVESINNR